MNYLEEFMKRFGRKPTRDEENYLLNQSKPFYQLRKKMEAEGTWRGVPSDPNEKMDLNLSDDHPWKDRPTELTRGALEIQKNHGAWIGCQC